jgi:hypothetical protein
MNTLRASRPLCLPAVHCYDKLQWVVRAAPVLALLMAGCGSSGYGHDVKGFTQQAKTPADQAVLRSIGTYRTTEDEKVACALITQHFLKLRFEGKAELCEAIARHQNKRELPESAEVGAVAGDSVTVRVDEPTATKSLYKMKRLSGTWKIDDIVEAP